MEEYSGGSSRGSSSIPPVKPGSLARTGRKEAFWILFAPHRTARVIRHCAATLLLTLTALVLVYAQGVSEIEVKAAFIYHFTDYVEWPAGAFVSASAPFVIGVVGKTDVFAALQNAVRGKRWNGRDLVVRRVETAKEMRECHVLFIPDTEARRLAQILEALGDAPILTVGESEGFAKRGGMINFFMDQNRVRFEINPDAAKRVHLTISSKLLNLARIVRR